MGEIMLSIMVTTYNHEKYISRALDSILSQNISYPYEVLIGEDCSTDGTRSILMSYEKLVPNNFHFFYREHNMYMENPNNSSDLLRRSRGKYLILLEGDDFWTDENKIDEQIQFLERNEEYIGVAHNCVVVGEDSMPNGEKYPECKDLEYTYNHYLSEILPGQTATIMYRRSIYDDYDNLKLKELRCSKGDRKLIFILLSNGRIFCIQKQMSAYRHIKNYGSSFSANYKYNFEEEERIYKAFLEYAKKKNNMSSIKASNILYFRNIMSGYRQKKIGVRELISYSSNCDSILFQFLNWFIYKIKKDILKQKIWFSVDNRMLKQ